MKYKKPSGVPWRLWAVLLTVGIALMVIYWLDPPSFEYSSPRLEMHGDAWVAAFDAINHTHRPMTRTLSVSVGTLHRGIKGSGPRYIPLDHREISVTLAPSETRHIHCEFSDLDHVPPSAAEVTILP